MKKRKDAEARRDALVKEQRELLEKFKDGGFTDEARQENLAIEAKLEEEEAIIAQCLTDETAIRKAKERELLLNKDRMTEEQRRKLARDGDRQLVQPYANIGEFLQEVYQAGIPGGSTNPRLIHRIGPDGELLAAAQGSIAAPSQGGFIVYDDYSTQIRTKIFETSSLASRCFSRPLGNGFDETDDPYLVENSRATGSRYGGVRVYRAGEAQSVTAFTAGSLKRMKCNAPDLMAFTVFTRNQLRDAAGFASLIMSRVPAEYAWVLDNELLNGNGANCLQGILNSPALLTASKEGGQAADTFTAPNVSAMWKLLYGPSRSSALWIYNQEMESEFDAMTFPIGTAGVPIYFAPGSFGLNGNPTLKQRPMIAIEQCSKLGDLGDILLVDLSQYMLVPKGGMESAESIHVYFDTAQTAFRWMWSIGGMGMWESSLTPANANTGYKLAPFVVMQARD